MSHTNSLPEGFLHRIKAGSTLSIFGLFIVVFLFAALIFFLVLDHNQQAKNNEIIRRFDFKAEIIDLKNQIETEAQNSLKSSLLYMTSGKEIDRFQTIYSLKSTKNLFDELHERMADYTKRPEVNNTYQTMAGLLTEYDQHVAEAINQDGRLLEILNRSEQEADTTSGDFLFDEATLDMGILEVKQLQAIFENIQNQLFLLENQFDIIIGDEIESITSRSPLLTYVFFSIILVLLLVLLGYLVVQKLKSSVSDLSEMLDHIAKGELPDNDINQGGEFAKIVGASNELVHYLDDASQFAVKIGDGDFGYEFKPKSELDALGNSLIDMRNRLQQVAREDKIRNWINEGQAKFGEILRQHSDDIEKLGANIIIQIVEYLNASQGALFVLKDEHDEQYLELLSAYAYKRKKYINKRIEIGEGLAGQAFEERKTIYMTDIKTDHYDIQTGLGESRPSSLLIVPLKNEERIEGVIEIASLKEIDRHQIEFVESIGESIASSLNAGKINLTTKRLLEDTKEKAEQMKAQEEELRQNMEELAATQEQVARRNTELEEIQQKLNEEKYLLNALLNTTHDRIYFKDKDSKFIRVSQSMIELFDKKDESEILGKSDFDFGFEEHAKVAFDDEQRIMRTGKALIDAVEKEKWDDGRVTWVSTTKNPLLDLDGKVIGTFGISRDITKNKEVELEMIKRKEWLENFFQFHPVGFVVLDQHGKVNFATKSILSKINKENIDGLAFDDIFKGISFERFLADIDFENTKDKELEIKLILNDKSKKQLIFLVITGSKENEDGTQNIFLIQK